MDSTISPAAFLIPKVSPPAADVYKRQVQEGRMVSDVMTASYIINENHTMDVVSLASDPDGLFEMCIRDSP